MSPIATRSSPCCCRCGDLSVMAHCVMMPTGFVGWRRQGADVLQRVPGQRARHRVAVVACVCVQGRQRGAAHATEKVRGGRAARRCGGAGGGGCKVEGKRGRRGATQPATGQQHPVAKLALMGTTPECGIYMQVYHLAKHSAVMYTSVYRALRRKLQTACTPRLLHGLAAQSASDAVSGAGLFGLPDLCSPSQWSVLASHTVQRYSGLVVAPDGPQPSCYFHRCNELVQAALTHQRPTDVVQAIDDISDVVRGLVCAHPGARTPPN